jgi:H+-transporting ATPase
MPDTSEHPLRTAIGKFWAPVPWMLEAAIILEVVLGKYVEAAIMATLLVFNAALGLFQESRAQATLAALKSRLAMNASVERDGHWKTVPATELVPGDVVKLTLGGVVAADVKISGGEVQLDQSMLTGESVPIEAGEGVATFAGALVRRGEATAEVTATGTRTKFGRTAELVRTAHVVSSQQKAVLRVVGNLAVFNGFVILMLVGYAYFLNMPFAEIIPLLLTAILATIPVALPATFTLAASLGARSLAKQGVLPTRLSAVDEAGTTDVLCADKTGTLTQNALTVTSINPMPGFDEPHVLALAALASSEGGQDPVDGAIRAAAAAKTVSDAPKLVKYVPFDPAKKMSEASATDSSGAVQRIVKGAFAVVIGLTPPSPAGAREIRPRPRASSPMKWDSTVLSVRRVPSPRAFVRSSSRCLPGCSRRISTSWSRPFRREDIRWACAATAPMTHPPLGRRRSALRCRQRPMWPSRPQAWYSPEPGSLVSSRR